VLNSQFQQLAARHPDHYSGWRVLVDTADRGFYSKNDYIVVTLLYLISGGVLLISCANVANLLIARGAARSREMAIRSALGASRSRILVQSLTESLCVALPAGAFAIFVGGASALALLSGIHVPFPIPKEFLNRGYLAFNLAAAIGSVLLFGLFPAWAAARKQTPGVPQDGGPRATLSASANRLSRGLVILQVSIGLALVMTAMIGLRGVSILTDLGPGYDHSQVVRASAGTVRLKPASDDTVRSQILARVSAAPSIASAGWLSAIPGVIGADGLPLGVESTHLSLDRDRRPVAHTITATRGALETLRIPLQQGRYFEARDSATSDRVAIVNRNLCDQLLPGRNPIGESIRLDSLGPQPFRIIGVYGNLLRADVKLPAAPQAFLLADQIPGRELSLVARYNRETEAFAAIRAAIHSLDAEAPVELHKLTEDVSDGLRNGRTLNWLMAVLAGLALFFGACGLFAVISQTVTQRLPEIGVRLALGASAGSIRGMILLSGVRCIALGAIFGLACGALLGNLLASQLIDVHPWDWQVWLPSVALFLAVSLAALAAPTQRAADTDILSVMRRD